MNTKAILETTTSVFLGIDEFNELRKAEPYKRLMESGHLDLVLICYEQSARITVSGTTTVRQVINAAKALLKVTDFGTDTELVTVDGIFLEYGRRLEELKFEYGEKLFLR